MKNRSPQMASKLVPIDRIQIDARHFKREIPEGAIQDRARSISDTGQIKPLFARVIGPAGGMHGLLAGELDLLALHELGEPQALCLVVGQCSDTTAREVSLRESLKANDLSLEERRRAMKELVFLYGREIPPGRSSDVSAGSTAKSKRGRPQSPQRQAIRRVAQELQLNERTIWRALQPEQDLGAGGQRRIGSDKQRLQAEPAEAAEAVVAVIKQLRGASQKMLNDWLSPLLGVLEDRKELRLDRAGVVDRASIVTLRDQLSRFLQLLDGNPRVRAKHLGIPIINRPRSVPQRSSSAVRSGS